MNKDQKIATLATGTAGARKKLTMYRADDDGAARFRLEAMRHCSELTIAAITGRPYSAELTAWLAVWLSDPVDSAIGSAVGAFVLAVADNSDGLPGVEPSILAAAEKFRPPC